MSDHCHTEINEISASKMQNLLISENVLNIYTLVL